MAANPFRLLLAIEKLLVKLETGLLTITLLAMLTIASIQVFLRKFFTAWFWADEFNQFMVIYVGFLGAVLAVKENRHLSMEVLTNFLPKKAKPIIGLFVNLFVLVVTGILTNVAYLYFQYKLEREVADEMFPGFPKAYFAIVFPLGFGLVFLHFFFRLVELIYKFAGGDRAYPKGKGGGHDIEISVNIKM